MRRDSVSLVWLKRTALAALILLIQTTGKAAAGHGDADDAASCRSLMLNRIDLAVQVSCDLQSIRKRAVDFFNKPIGMFDRNLWGSNLLVGDIFASDFLASDFFALIQQDFEMRLCEWRALELHGETHSDIDQQQ